MIEGKTTIAPNTDVDVFSEDIRGAQRIKVKYVMRLR
jgi:hypothetical protein